MLTPRRPERRLCGEIGFVAVSGPDRRVCAASEAQNYACYEEPMNTAFYGHEDPISATTPADETRREEIDALADTIAVSAARIDAATHELCTSIRRFDELGGWAWQGATSCAAWLSWRLGLGVGAAGEKVRVARALGELPRIDAAFAAGELSYCKVRAMTRVATEATGLLEWREALPGPTGESVPQAPAGRAGGGEDGREAARGGNSTVRCWQRMQTAGSGRQQPGGMVRIEMQLLPDEAELVWQALAEVRAELVTDARDDAASAGGREADLSAESAADLVGAGAEAESHAAPRSRGAVEAPSLAEAGAPAGAFVDDPAPGGDAGETGARPSEWSSPARAARAPGYTRA